MKDIPDIAPTIAPPYYAVIFTSLRTAVDDSYSEVARSMVELAAAQPGFLGIETVRENGLGITVSYWQSEQDIMEWKRNLDHLEAQTAGRDRWYARYRVRIARVERDYGFEQSGRPVHG